MWNVRKGKVGIVFINLCNAPFILRLLAGSYQCPLLENEHQTLVLARSVKKKGEKQKKRPKNVGEHF